jgi:hypothetical protein
MKKKIKKNIIQVFWSGIINFFEQIKMAKTRKISRQKGAGSWLEYLTKPDKRAEIPAQIEKLIKEWASGHPMLSIGRSGRPSGNRLVPLNKIILFHPVRGPTERATAGAKTTKRKEVVINYLRAHASEPRIEFTTELVNSDESLEALRSVDPIDAVMITPLLQYERDLVHSLQKRSEFSFPTRATIQEIDNQVKGKVAELRSMYEGHGEISKTAYQKMTKLHYPKRSDTVPLFTQVDPFFVISSGQGRLQAIKEAVDELELNPTKIFIEVRLMAVERNMCGLFVIIGNEFRTAGEFSDMRHVYDNYIIPSARSCNPDGPTKDDMLSLYQELDLDVEERKKYFDEKAYEIGKYSNNAARAGREGGGSRKKTNKKQRKFLI